VAFLSPPPLRPPNVVFIFSSLPTALSLPDWKPRRDPVCSFPSSLLECLQTSPHLPDSVSTPMPPRPSPFLQRIESSGRTSPQLFLRSPQISTCCGELSLFFFLQAWVSLIISLRAGCRLFFPFARYVYCLRLFRWFCHLLLWSEVNVFWSPTLQFLDL